MGPVFLFDAGPPAPPGWVAEVAHRVELYGRLEGHLAFSEDGVDVADSGSRFGFEVEQAITEDIAAFGLGEWSMNLGEGDKTYQASQNPDTDFGTFESSTEQAFGTRYGYIGVRFGPYGKLILGKQDGVYYDISGWTDVYAAFGGKGSSTYNAGTDGGQTGTGRANDAVTYRIPLGPVEAGVQAQFLDTRAPEVDGLAGSLVVTLGRGLSLGVAYAHSFLDFDVDLVGWDGSDAQAFTSGIKFDRSGWTLAVVDTWTHNHELVPGNGATVMYDTLGAELFAARRFPNGLMAYVGFDFSIPRALDARFVDPNYGTRDLLGGLRYYFERKSWSFFYLEGRSGSSRDAIGERAADIVTLGMRLQFSMRRALGLEP